MFNFSQISAFFKFLIDFPVLAPYLEALMDFMHESVKLANEIKEPIAAFLIGEKDSSKLSQNCYCIYFGVHFIVFY